MSAISDALQAKNQRQMQEIQEGMENQSVISDNEVDKEIQDFKQNVKFISKPINDADPWVEEMLK